MDKTKLYLSQKRVKFVVEYQKPKGKSWIKWASFPRFAEAQAEVVQAKPHIGDGTYLVRILRQDVVTTSYLAQPWWTEP